ncbi:MAG: FAD-dependent oxidoreductase [Thermodesulfobacteriota bacterium]
MTHPSQRHHIRTAPCQAACPAGVDVPRYIRALRNGRFTEALSIVRERLPFAVACAFACTHPCESACSRQWIDGAVAIRDLKRAAVELAEAAPVAPAASSRTGKRVAIVGSGPAGLSAAWWLSGQGHEVVVFEARSAPGGMLRHAIPEYRLPASLLESDIQWISANGVCLKTNTRIDHPETLLQEGFDAVLLATGAWKSLRLNIPGETEAMVKDGLKLLQDIRSGQKPSIGNRVVVIGGGNTAVDAARVCRRCGAAVTLMYRRTRKEMPALPEEVEAALEEGVRMRFLAAPIRIEPNRIECVRMRLGEPDASGRARPIATRKRFWLDASTLLVAIGQEVSVAEGIQTTRYGTIDIDPQTGGTSIPGIFACGDAVSGPSSIIEAVAQGKHAAAAIDRQLGGSATIDPWSTGGGIDADPDEPLPPGYARISLQRRTPSLRIRDWGLVEEGLNASSAMTEAGRCISCDIRRFEVAVEAELCKDCGYCREVCPSSVFVRSDAFNSGGYRPAIAIRAEDCVCCIRCVYICPDFAIHLRELDKREEMGNGTGRHSRN